MSNFINIETKEDALEQIKKLEGIASKFKFSADELNLIRDKINELYQLLQQVDGGGSIVVQESTVFTYLVSQHSVADARLSINNSTANNNFVDVSGVYIKTIAGFFSSNPTLRLYKLISKPFGKTALENGVYGLNAKQINHNDYLEFIRETKPSAQDIQDSPGTVTENLGDLGTTSVKDYINGLINGLTLINSTDTLTIINAVVDGLDISYRYVGGDATYGANDSTITDSNLELLEKEENQIQLYWEPGITVAGQPVTQIRPANNRVVSGTHLKDNSTPETKLTQNVKDKLNTLQATPETLATASQITVPLNRIMGTDFTGTVTNIENFKIDTANVVLGSNAIYLYKANQHPIVTGATWLKSNSDYKDATNDFIANQNYYLVFIKQADGIYFWLIEKQV